MTAEDVVVFSLETWDDVWRRNQFFVRELLRERPTLRALFVEPPVDIPQALKQKEWPDRSGLRPIEGAGDVSAAGRLWALHPYKVWPTSFGPWAGRGLWRQVGHAMKHLELRDVTFWVNDDRYAPWATCSGRPVVYDITDDWLLAEDPPRILARRRRHDEMLMRGADEVVVCSRALQVSRGQSREVTLIENGVDAGFFRAPQPEPVDLPRSPRAVYVGTLHENRLDVDLCCQLASRDPGLAIVLVGPDCLSSSSHEALSRHPNVVLLGSRPYQEVPSYLQHADVVIVPHVVTPFTNSLDPIKAYECLAVGRPTVSTPIVGFQEIGPPIMIAEPEDFPELVVTLVTKGTKGAGIRPDRTAPRKESGFRRDRGDQGPGDQDTAGQDTAGQDTAGQGTAGQGTAGQDKGDQATAGQDKGDQGTAGQVSVPTWADRARSFGEVLDRASAHQHHQIGLGGNGD